MTTHINDGGTWRQIQQVHVNDGGTWRNIQSIHVNDSGTWRKVFDNLAVQILTGAFAYVSAAGDCGFQFANTGVFTGSTGGGGGAPSPYNWLLSGAAASADILFHKVSGTAAGTFDTWMNLGTSRSVTLPWPGGVSSSNSEIDVSIRNASTLVVLVNAARISMATHP